MNQGLYGFPSTIGVVTPNIISITEFDVSSTYSIPYNCESLQILLIGGGGGGGGGGSGNNVATNSGGGGGGGGGSVVYQECLITDNLGGTTLVITIGAGGFGGTRGTAGGAGSAGAPGSQSTITVRGRPGFFMRAIGGPAGLGGTTPTVNGAALGGAGRISSINGAQVTNTSGSNGSWTLGTNDSGWTGTNYYIVDMRSNGGAGGGSPLSNTTATKGGSIERVDAATVNTPIVYDMNTTILIGSTAGVTAAFGGNTGGGLTGIGQNGQYMIANSLRVFAGGIGGAGGGGSNRVSGSPGGNGYRGGGGGGGGGGRAATAIPGGTGGNGGNGYCVIIARG